MNNKILFNANWVFSKTSIGCEAPDTNAFESIDIPHDWLIYSSENLYQDSIGWYKKIYTHNNDARVSLCFDGVYMDSSLYVNNTFVGDWKYGYSSSEYEITHFLVQGENEILLKVVHQHPNSRWYSGAGIYRNVWLKQFSDTHIVSNGVYISTKKNEQNWTMEIETELSLNCDTMVSHALYYEDSVVAQTEKIINFLPVKQSENGTDKSNIVFDLQHISIKDPLLWNPDSPHLYKVHTKIFKIVDSQMPIFLESAHNQIGFKEIEYKADAGMFVNGLHTKIKGVCEHHDLGSLGAAFNTEAIRKRFAILKSMGVNAIRTAHNMPSPEYMDLADQIGFFIVSEAFDMWELPKTKFDYARFFNDWYKKDVESWVKRDRNHPSLLMWSIGNEIFDTHNSSERGLELTTMLIREVLRFDPKKNAAITLGSNYMPWENTQKCAEVVDIVGYNYGEKYYQVHHERYPHWIIYGSETGSIVQSRGVYHFPYESPLLAEEDEQCSALGNSTTSWGAKSIDSCILDDMQNSFSLGQFIWTGFDYIGEPTPYHTKNSYFGQIDTAGFKKDSFYLYQAAWTDYKQEPMVHIFPYWDFNKGQIIDVFACTNAPYLELFFNKKSLGVFEFDKINGKKLAGHWKIPYTKGILKAVAYDEHKNIIATDIKKSFGDASQICVTSDKDTLVANGVDLIYATIFMRDKKGTLVENASNRIHVSISGQGRIVGIDNGDSTDYDQYKGLSKRLFNGKLLVIIASTLDAGSIRLTTSSEGLQTVVTEFSSIAPEALVENSTAHAYNKEEPIVLGHKHEIPLRKIELICKGKKTITKKDFDLHVQAKLYPPNTSYTDLEWSLTDKAGVSSSIATLTATGLRASISACADGDFRLRCSSKNGSKKTRIISELEFSAKNIGTYIKNPYSFISALLHDYTKGEIRNGNEKGIATSSDGESQVGYKNLNFEAIGSDSITIPIFALNSDPYSIQIWDGVPYEQYSSMIGDFVYQKESIWNVYQEETFKLSKKLTGIQSLYFVFTNKVHVKGFIFNKFDRSFDKVNVTQYDTLYGDAFSIKENCIEQIGNNVSIGFDNFKFETKKPKKVLIFGKTANEKNVIQMHFEQDDYKHVQLLEIPHTKEYTEFIFDLDNFKAAQKVTFVFLPGSNFNFSWFQFI